MQNCFDCKHKVTVSSDLFPAEVTPDMVHINGTRYGKCLAGHTSTLVQYWHDNAHKSRGDVVEVVECFEPTEVAKKLDSLIDLANEALEEVRESGGECINGKSKDENETNRVYPDSRHTVKGIPVDGDKHALRSWAQPRSHP